MTRFWCAVALTMAVAAGASAQDPSFTTQSKVDATDGLVINGERIADKALLAEARKEGTFVLYTSAGEDYERMFTARFKADTGVDTRLVRLVVNRMAERVMSELGAGKLAADVIRMSDPPTVDMLVKAKVFQPYRVPFDAELDANSKVSDQGLFYRYSSSVYTVGYNAQLVRGNDIPTSWKDLTNPKWKGKVGIVNISAGGSSQALARFHRARFGDEYLAAYAAQNPRIYDSASTLLSSIARGELLAGIVIPARVNVAVAAGAPVKFVIPTEGLSGWDFFIGLTSSSKSAAGKLFINWVMTRYAQQLITELGDYSARADVAPPTVMGTQLPPLSNVTLMTMGDAVAHQVDDQAVWYKAFNYKP